MFRNPMQAILQFAENRGEDANILTGRLNQVFGPVADMLVPASAPETSPFPPPQRPRAQGPQLPTPPIAGVASAGAGFTNVELPDGTVQRREGTRAWRNNNPGNIEFGDFARSRGAVGSDGRFAVFPTYEEGRAAKEALLFESPSYRDRTIAGAINRYAPPSENDTRNYIGGITSALGVSPDTPLSDLTPQQRDIMLNTMERIEGFRPGRVDGVNADEVYRNLSEALDVRVSSSGRLTDGDRRSVEAMFGDILNEIHDPASAIEDERRNRVADLLTGLGVGFGQMSRGDAVDLSEVRNAAERRRNQNIQLRMERAKRAAGASYAMELGDEGLARAIAGGAADVNTLLTKRQQDMVEARALRQEAQQFATNESLIAALEEGGMTISDAKRTAIMNGGPAVLDTLFTQQERARALESLETKREIDESVQTANMAIADLVSEQAEQSGDPRQLMIAQIMRAAQGTKSYAEAEAEAGSLFAAPSEAGGFTLSPGQTRFDASGAEVASLPDRAASTDPIVAQNNIAAAQMVLTDPNAPDAAVNAARLVFQSGGTMSMDEAAKQVTAGGAFTPAPASESTTNIRDYEFYAQQERAEGRQPMPFEQWRQSKPAGVNVNIAQPGSPAGVHPVYGSPPPNTVWDFETDEQGNVQGALDANGNFVPRIRMTEGPDGRQRPSSVPIAGGPAAQAEADRIAAAEAAAAEAAARQSRGRFLTQNILREVNEAMRNLDAGMGAGLLDTAGLTGTLLSLIPGTQAADLRNLLDSLQGASALEQLSMLKEATGAGLGNVTERQLDLLATAFGSLRQSSSNEMLRKNLANVANIMTDITFGAGNTERFDERGNVYTPSADTLGLSDATFGSFIQANEPDLIVPLINDFYTSRGVPPILSDDALMSMPPAYRRMYLDTVRPLLGE